MSLTRKIRHHFYKHKKFFIKNTSQFVFFFFIAIVIVGFKFLYPFHLILAIPFVVLALVSILKIFVLGRYEINRSAKFNKIKRYLARFEKLFYILFFISVIWYILSQVIPNDTNPYKNMTDKEVVEFVDQSLDLSTLHLDRLEITANTLLESNILKNSTLTADELTTLQANWNDFIDATKDSEELTDIHRYFGQISYFNLPETHTKSFMISYGLYMKKFELFGKIIDATENNDRVIKALNENSTAFGGKNSYYDIRNRHIGHNTLLRRNLGRIYLNFLEKTVDTKSLGEDYQALVRASKASHQYLVANSLNTTKTVVDKYSDDFENGLFNSWFPIQMSVADTMGKIHLSARHTNFITEDQIKEMKPRLEPGDIFIERRNWHLSNVGIPGFWPHAALYLGTNSEMNDYFKEQFPREGFSNLDELVKYRFPAFYNQHKAVNEKGHNYAVIEGQAPGIILLSLEESGMADYLGVLRPKLSKEEKLNAVLRAIGNYGKPYDYNFDFETRDEIVCSELVYDAYLPNNGGRGLNFELTLTSGRKMISPNAIVEKFYNEHNTEEQELDFVYFLDGNEDLQKAFIKDENAFLTSWTRSKFSNLQE